jgi:hypothetical protein
LVLVLRAQERPEAVVVVEEVVALLAVLEVLTVKAALVDFMAVALDMDALPVQEVLAVEAQFALFGRAIHVHSHQLAQAIFN